MQSNRKINFIFSLLIFFTSLNAEDKPGGDDLYYLKGIKALSENNIDKAENYFLISIREFDDAPSYFQLGKINLDKDTYQSRNKALKYFEQAVWRDSINLEYRYAYASLLEDFARFSAIDQYKKIIEQDNKQIEAWNSLARLEEAEFVEFNNSVRNMDGFMGSLQEFAMEDFAEAEYYMLKALEVDSMNFETNFKLGRLYENAEYFDKAIPYFEKSLNIKNDDKETYLYLALLYYKTSQMEKSDQYYRKAFRLMEREERKEYTFESAKSLLEPAFGKMIENYADWETEQFIEAYWDVNDPLYLSDFNERVLEHYSRVAFAKLHFTVEEMDINGWKSDKGEFVLRYGEPRKRMRIRPEKNPGSVAVKTEVWYYNGMSLAFTDFASSGNYQYSAPTADNWKMKSQYGGDSQWFAENLKTVAHEIYEPKYEGPVFDVPFDIVQFRSANDRNRTDIYINYGLNLNDSTYLAADINYDHEVGLFFFDRYHEKMFQRRRDINSSDLLILTISENEKFLIHSEKFTVSPDSGLMAFEIQRNADKGVSSNRFKLVTKKFTRDGFGISDILLASLVTESDNKSFKINREQYSLKPNPIHIFSSEIPLYIYFEIYNLDLDSNKLTDFEQEIVISKIEAAEGEGSFFDGILSFLGLDSSKKITLTANYQTQETNPQLFLQIDMSDNEPGEYLIELTITDKLNGNVSAANTMFFWN